MDSSISISKEMRTRLQVSSFSPSGLCFSLPVKSLSDASPENIPPYRLTHGLTKISLFHPARGLAGQKFLRSYEDCNRSCSRGRHELGLSRKHAKPCEEGFCHCFQGDENRIPLVFGSWEHNTGVCASVKCLT